MRRRILLALTLVVGVFVFQGSASATHDLLDFESTVDEMLAVDPTLEPPPNDGKHDFVVGGFQQTFNWGLSAHSGPSGEDPFGHVSVTAPLAKGNPDLGKQAHWRVTCVNVVGNLAAIGGEPTEAASNDLDSPAVFVFRDAGPGGGKGPGAAQLDGFRFFSGDIPASECRNPQVLGLAAVAPPIENGNILVHDAQP